MERLSYFMHNQSINDEVLYVPLLKQFLQESTGQELVLAMDTSMFWDTYCLIEVCVTWAVLTNTPISLQTFQLYGKRFGGIEPRFKDYKSGTFDILRSKIRNAQALSNLLMMIEIAEVLAIRLGLIIIQTRQRSKVDWHGDRGLSLLQLGIRTVKSLSHQALPLPLLTPIPWMNISPAYASLKHICILVGW